jgi:hypothetical protein
MIRRSGKEGKLPYPWQNSAPFSTSKSISGLCPNLEDRPSGAEGGPQRS